MEDVLLLFRREKTGAADEVYCASRSHRARQPGQHGRVLDGIDGSSTVGGASLYSHRTEHSRAASRADWPTMQELVASRQPRSIAWMPLEREIFELETLPSAEKTTCTTADWGAGQLTCRSERSTGHRSRSLGPVASAFASSAGKATRGLGAALAVCTCGLALGVVHPAAAARSSARTPAARATRRPFAPAMIPPWAISRSPCRPGSPCCLSSCRACRG